MNILLSTSTEQQLVAIEKYAQKNNKLLCLRDKNNKILAIGLSLRALQQAKAEQRDKSKHPFYYYQVLHKLTPIFTSNVPKEVINNNYQVNNVIYDVYIEVYEGKVIQKDIKAQKAEDYWFNSYQFYLKKENIDKFGIFDLINKKVTSNYKKNK